MIENKTIKATKFVKTTGQFKWDYYIMKNTPKIKSKIKLIFSMNISIK